MPFTARFDSVSKAGDPGAFDLGLTYLDADHPDWKVEKTLRVTFDPSQTGAQQRAAIQSQISADALRYKQQLATEAALQALVGQSITI